VVRGELVEMQVPLCHTLYLSLLILSNKLKDGANVNDAYIRDDKLGMLIEQRLAQVANIVD